MKPQVCIDDHGREYLHREQPSRKWDPCRVTGKSEFGEHWENSCYYGCFQRFATGFPIGGGPYAIISITATSETARHDWRDFQRIKNDLVGAEWEAVELYPAESRLIDPSNRFYLWCAPKGVFAFGRDEGRKVLGSAQAKAPQRPFGEPWDHGRMEAAG